MLSLPAYARHLLFLREHDWSLWRVSSWLPVHANQVDSTKRIGDGMDLTNVAGRGAGGYLCERRHEAIKGCAWRQGAWLFELEQEILEAVDELEAVDVSVPAAAELSRACSAWWSSCYSMESSHDYSSIS